MSLRNGSAATVRASAPARALRLVLGTGALVAGGIVIGAILGGSSASADEPTSEGLLGSVSSVVLDESLGTAPQQAAPDVAALVPAVAAVPDVAELVPVAAAVPDVAAASVPQSLPQLLPQPAIIEPVVTDVVQRVVQRVADAPIPAVVAKVAAPVDAVVGALPVASGLVGDAPVRDLVGSVAQFADDTLPRALSGAGLVKGLVKLDAAESGVEQLDADVLGSAASPDLAPSLAMHSASASGTASPAPVDRASAAAAPPGVSPVSQPPVSQPSGTAPLGTAPPGQASAGTGAAASGGGGATGALGDSGDTLLSPALLRDAAHGRDDEPRHPPTFPSDSTPD